MLKMLYSYFCQDVMYSVYIHTKEVSDRYWETGLIVYPSNEKNVNYTQNVMMMAKYTNVL